MITPSTLSHHPPRAPHTHLDDLPQQAQDEVRFGVHDILWSNVDDVAANRGSGIEGKGLVLVNGEGVELSLVDCPLIHCVLH